MSKPANPASRDIQPDPTAIGNVVKPPFARLPEPEHLFARRATRLRQVATGHELAPYLLFLAELAQLQSDIQDGLPEPWLPAADVLDRAAQHAMPPLDRNRFAPDPAYDMAEERLFAGLGKLAMPEAARLALGDLLAQEPAARLQMARSVLADAVPVESMASHIYVAAALQVHFARAARRLSAERLVPVGDGVCPACGGPPVASMIVGWPNAVGARFCACALCQTWWNYVRARCCLCGSTEDISFREVEGGNGTIKAEVCGRCKGYVKVLHQHQDPALEPVADDIASLGLDLLTRESGFRRGGFNPFLIGF